MQLKENQCFQPVKIDYANKKAFSEACFLKTSNLNLMSQSQISWSVSLIIHMYCTLIVIKTTYGSNKINCSLKQKDYYLKLVPDVTTFNLIQ